MKTTLREKVLWPWDRSLTVAALIAACVYLFACSATSAAPAAHLTILGDNTEARSGVKAVWGFACLVEAHGHTVLFDTGADPAVLKDNLAAMKVDPAKIEAVVISHWHPDHTQGAPGLGKLAGVRVFTPRGLEDFAKLRSAGVEEDVARNIADRLAKETAKLTSAGLELVVVSQATPLFDGIAVSEPLPFGQIPTDKPGRESTYPFWEQCLTVDTPEGLVVIVGCSHPGILSMLEQVKRQTGRPLHLVIGGFHLLDQPETEVRGIATAMQAMGLAYVSPTHCTGEAAVRVFRDVFRDRYVSAGVGAIINLPVAAPATTASPGQWKPAEGRLMTRWAKDVSPDNVHTEYPRPQMVRQDWLNLNGLWEYAICAKDVECPDSFDEQILVPFPVESALSGVGKPVGPENRLWYLRKFEIPAKWKGKRVLLHFGAVDWEATVWVNGEELETHRGGYDPFSFDITDALKESGEQEIAIRVWDPTDAGSQPRGKQVRKPNGIWYTAVTGIWQTVWLEPVNSVYIKSLEMQPDIDSGTLRLRVEIGGQVSKADKFEVRATIPGPGVQMATDIEKAFGFAHGVIGKELQIRIKDPKLWTPDSPYLYDLEVALGEEASRTESETPKAQTVSYETVDRVTTYFGMRKISLGKDQNGVLRLCLNNKPLFQYGPLDQGFWPDGIYAAPTDEALRYDIEVLKKLGCNMMRKHVKVEPARFYYWCDKLGLLVWQDMPSGNNRSDADKKQFELELTRLVESHYNSPSIVMWVPFNEGWGQHNTARVVERIRKRDPTRLVDQASGWKDEGVGDVQDIHSYPGPAAPPVEEKRAAVLGEFGGLGLPIKGHTWQDEKNWGYRTYTTREELTDAYVALLGSLRLLIAGGLSAAVYTQTTDVEIEVNGLMTYDRAMIKMDAERAAAAARRLFLPPPVIKIVLATSREQGQAWRYTISEPATGWQQSDFDDSAWQKGPGGFGTKGTPGSVVRTEWKTPDIWLRREFVLETDKLEQLYLDIHHDEDAQVYLNGVPAAKLQGYTTSYVQAPD